MYWIKTVSFLFSFLLLSAPLCHAKPEDPEVLYRDAMRSGYYQDNYCQALTGLGKVCKEFPESISAARARFVITCILKYKLSLQECISLKSSSQEIDGIDSHFLQAVFYLRLGEEENALLAFQGIFSELMTNPWSQEAKDIFDSAVWDWDILEKNPIQSARMYLALFEYACAKDKKNAEDYFRKIISFRRQEEIEAIEITAYEKMIEAFPEKEADYIRTLAQLYQKVGDSEKTIISSKRALSLAKDASEIHSIMSILSSVYEKQKLLPEKIKEIKGRLDNLEKELSCEKIANKEELLQKVYVVCVELGFLQKNYGNYNSAIKAYERAFELQPEDIRICWTLLELYRDRDLSDNVLAMYEYMYKNFNKEIGHYTKGSYATRLAASGKDPMLALRIAMEVPQKEQRRWLQNVYEGWGEIELCSERFFDDREHPVEAVKFHKELAQIFSKEEMFEELLCEYKKIFVLEPNKENFTQFVNLCLKVGLQREVEKWLQYAQEFVPELRQIEAPVNKIPQQQSLGRFPGRILWRIPVVYSGLYDVILNIAGDTAYSPAGDAAYRLLAVYASTGEIYKTFNPPLPEPGEENEKEFWWEANLYGVEADEDVAILQVQHIKRKGSSSSGDERHYYIVVDRFTGNLLWQSFPGEWGPPRHILESGNIYSYNYNKLTRHDKKTGAVKWEAGRHIQSRPYVYSGYVYLYVYDNVQKCLKIDNETGKIIREYNLKNLLSPNVSWEFIKVWNDNIMIFVNIKGDLLACDITQDKELWQHKVDADIYGKTNIAFRDKKLFTGDADGNVLCIDIPTGKIEWKRNLGHGKKIFTCDDRYLYVGGQDLWLTALSPETGEYAWSFPIKCQKPVDAQNGIILCSGSGNLGGNRSYYGIYALNRDVVNDKGQNRVEQLIRLAKRLSDDRQNDLALEVLYLVIDVVDPGYTPAYVELATLYENMGNRDEAAKMTGLAIKTLVPGQSVDSALEQQKKKILNILWQTRTEAGSPMKPASDGKNIYVAYNSHGNNKARIYAVSLSDGEILWQKSFEKMLGSAMALSDGRIFVGEDREPKFYALDSTSGEILWTFSTTEDFEFPSYPVVVDGLVYFTARAYNDGKFIGILYAFKSDTGKLVWQFSPQTQIVDDEWSDVRDYKTAVWKDMIFWGWNDGLLYALDLKDGSLRWKYNAYQQGELKNRKGGATTSPIVFEDKIFLASRNSHICLLDAITGKLIWQKHLSATNGTLFGGEEKLFVRGYDKRYYCFDAKTGTELWKTEPKFYYSGFDRYHMWNINEGYLYYPASNGYQILELTSGNHRYIGFKELPTNSSEQIWVDKEKVYLIGCNFITAYKKTTDSLIETRKGKIK